MEITFTRHFPSITFDSSKKRIFDIELTGGKYKFELWGASGGLPSDYNLTGSRGGYVSGITSFTNKQKLYLYLGEQGEFHMTEAYTHQMTFNGGGEGGIAFRDYRYGGASGGGATDIRLNKTQWNDFLGRKSRIIVAGGGAGAVFHIKYINGGSAGGHVGSPGEVSGNGVSISLAQGGTQNSGGIRGIGSASNGNDGQFGIGGDWCRAYSSSGGGGGYFGGGGGGISDSNHGSGGGGSSYISGYPNCKSIAISSLENPLTFLESSNHYSGIVFNQMKMIPGGQKMPSPNGETEICGHKGDGFIRITKLDFAITRYSKKSDALSFSFLVMFTISWVSPPYIT